MQTMKRRKRRNKKGKKPTQPKSKKRKGSVVIIDYYNRAFALLHKDYDQTSFYQEAPHPIRKRFWQFVLPGQYDSHEARPLLNQYITTLEKELSEIISQASLAYWLHLYRRLFPGPIGRDKQAQTIGLTRAILEAAIQKYAKFSPCSRIAFSHDVPLENILNGLLMEPMFELEREEVKEQNQLVLTNFGTQELKQFYDLEKLAYEVWRSTASHRTIGKGAPFLVEDSQTCFRDDRSDELDTLLTNYDSRMGGLVTHSSIGAVFEYADKGASKDIIFLPQYNLKRLLWRELRQAFLPISGLDLQDDLVFNFVWFPFDIRGFRKTHQPLAGAFEKKYGVSLDSVLCVVAALGLRVLFTWRELRGVWFSRHWQRAYEGPLKKEDVMEGLQDFLPPALRLLGIEDDCQSQIDLQKAFQFWQHCPSKCQGIDIAYSGPHSIFLPYSEDRVFIDYEWISRRLIDLFIGVTIPDQNFKGDALEIAIGRDASILPKRACRSAAGQEKQIDYAIAIKNILVIAECKVVGKSIAFERGDPRAIDYRRQKVVELALSEVDEKAEWLAQNPIGINYDISQYDYILPIAISPFVEYVPSLEFRYWVVDKIPRILTPNEFRDLLKNESAITASYNQKIIDAVNRGENAL